MKEERKMEHIVIADDLTGANAVSVLLRKYGINAVTWLEDNADLPCAEACVFTTDSRGLSGEEAYEKVLNLSRRFKESGTGMFSKRIDSTMRGNVGAELDGMLDALGRDVAAVCTPAYPDSGRTVENGILLIHGKPLSETELADDPKAQIVTSDIKDIICGQSKYKVYNIFSEDMQGSEKQLSEYLDAILNEGYRIIICDIKRNEDIVKLARVLRRNGHSFITADPGVLTAELAKENVRPQSKIFANKVLAVIGSVNVKTREQMEELWQSETGVGKVIVNTSQLVQCCRQKAEIQRVREEVKRLKDDCNIITIVGDGIYPEKRMEITEALSNVINDAFGNMTYGILTEWKCFRGLYTSGGDITRKVYDRCGVKGIQVLDEVLPLAVYGELIGSEFPNLKVITKGGSQGNRQAICQCVRYLLQHMEA